jgi:hypothetical protein
MSRCGAPYARARQRQTPRRARGARFGAEIGLCRTEHVFFEGEDLAVRQMICASDAVEACRRSPSCCRCRSGISSTSSHHAWSSITIRLLDPRC